MIFVDQLHRAIAINALPERIVSLVPSQTELLYDLGLDIAIVGITKFCVHPPHFRKEKTIVGGTKAVNYEKIKALHPDIILCNKEENTQEMIAELEKIAPVHISDVNSVQDCLELIGMYGKLFSKSNEAEKILMEIRQKNKDFEAFIHNRPTLKTAYFIWKNPWMVAAKGTFIDAMMAINNFENYFGVHERYPEIELLMCRPETADLVLLSSEPFPFNETHKEEVRQFFPNAKIFVVDGEAFSWYGTRLIKSFDYFRMLHQSLSRDSVLDK
ncbi:MAG TPA: helical backbone metal receptor [Aquaticitalea sp.]|nr:helical backbone metal receptor [Aquaticitalea sp.]